MIKFTPGFHGCGQKIQNVMMLPCDGLFDIKASMEDTQYSRKRNTFVDKSEKKSEHPFK